MSTPIISDINISTDGTAPGLVTVTVTADVANNNGITPEAYFPAQGMGAPMANSTGTTWTASNTEMYDNGEKLIRIQCRSVSASLSFKA